MTTCNCHENLKNSENSLRILVVELRTAASESKPSTQRAGNGGHGPWRRRSRAEKGEEQLTTDQDKLHEDILLLYEEALDIYTRLVGIRAEAGIG